MLEYNAAAAATFNAVSEGINICTPDGRIVFANDAYLNFLGMERDKVIGRLLKDLRPGAQLPEVIKSGKRLMHIARKEETDFYFCNMYPIRMEDGVVGGISVVTFIADAYKAKRELEEIENRNRQLLRRVSRANTSRYKFQDIIAVAPASIAVKELAMRIALTEATVLLESESGTGKEMYAQAMHNASARSGGVFMPVNCANFNAGLLESELFGYVEGAFTGAKKGGKMGLFEAANQGTIFLDEVSEIDLGLQAKLLRAIQEHKIRPVGGVKEIDVDVRIICACNANLHEYVDNGRFRKDLYYRLATFPIHIPPLRERRGDIPALVDNLMTELSHRLKRVVTVSPEALTILERHDWPGNVRELRNVLEFSAFLSGGSVITPADLPEGLSGIGSNFEELPLSERVRNFERKEIERALAKYGDSVEGKKLAAKKLGISMSGLYAKLKQ